MYITNTYHAYLSKQYSLSREVRDSVTFCDLSTLMILNLQPSDPQAQFCNHPLARNDPISSVTWIYVK